MGSTPAVFCSRGEGRYYVCETGSKFVGCCERNPCDTGCADEHLLPSYFTASTYASAPDLNCDSGHFYSCLSADGNGFSGCCRVNACRAGSGCPSEHMASASLNDDPRVAAYYLNITGTSRPRLPNSTDHSETNGWYVGDGTTTLRSIPAISGAAFAVLMLSVAVAVAPVVPYVSQLLRSRRMALSSTTSENIPFNSEDSTESAIETLDHTRQSSQSAILPKPFYERRQLLPLASILGPAVVVIVLVGFLGFIWFGNERIPTWNNLVAAERVTQSISITTLLIRLMVDTQASISAAMIAALMLESSKGGRLSDVAKLSILRYRASPWAVMKPIVRGFNHKTKGFLDLRFPVLLLSLLLTSVGLQFSSTILLSDLQLQALPGFVHKKNFPLDFVYDCIPSMEDCIDLWFNQIPRGTGWTINPSSYPPFGEYIEPVDNQKTDQDDTGVVLRALLPMADAESRQTLRNHTGPALVLDARVSCQAPKLDNFTLSASFYGNISGVVSNSIETARLQTITPTSFLCTFAGPSQVSVCQLGAGLGFHYIGSLKSELRNSSNFGTAFLVLEPAGSLEHGSFSTYGLDAQNATTSKRGAWTEVSNPSADFTLSTSLCFAPWDAARLDVNMYSSQNRTEPSPRWAAPATTAEYGSFNMDPLLHQLGMHPKSANETMRITPEGRGILNMDKPLRAGSNSSPSADSLPQNQRPFVQADISGAGGGSSGISVPLAGNWTAFLSGHTLDTLLGNFTYTPQNVLAAEPAISSLFNGAFRATNGSAARSLGAVITVLSATAYYGQLPAFDFVPEQGVEQIYFRTVLTPVRAGGLTALVWLLAAHTMIVSVVMIIHEGKVMASLLGEAWSCIAQLQGVVAGILGKDDDSERVMGETSVGTVGSMTDEGVEKELEMQGRSEVRARIVRSKDGEGKLMWVVEEVR